MANSSGSAASVTLKSLRHRALWVMLWLTVAFVLLAALYLFAASAYTYSSGERAGYIQKMSSKGWVCKTWEGELAMVNLPGATTQIFGFTVRDDRVAQEINHLAGKRVALQYEQHIGLPSCFGDTEYFVIAVREIGAQ
jgi:hypothetical protein